MSDMYEERYWAVQAILDDALGDGGDAGAGDGIAEDVALVVRQRDHYRNALEGIRQAYAPYSEAHNLARVALEAPVMRS